MVRELVALAIVSTSASPGWRQTGDSPDRTPRKALWALAYAGARPTGADRVLSAKNQAEARKAAQALGLETYSKNGYLFFVDPGVLRLKDMELRLAWMRRIANAPEGNCIFVRGDDLRAPEVQAAIRNLKEGSAALSHLEQNKNAVYMVTASANIVLTDGKRQVAVSSSPSQDEKSQRWAHVFDLDPAAASAPDRDPPIRPFDPMPAKLNSITVDFPAFRMEPSMRFGLLADLSQVLKDTLEPIERALDEGEEATMTKLGKGLEEFLGGRVIPSGTATADLPQKTRDELAKNVAGAFRDWGFSGPEEAEDFVRRSTVASANRSLVFFAAFKGPDGGRQGGGVEISIGSGR